MEKIKTLVSNKIFSYLLLSAGVVSLLFIGQENQISIFAWVAPLLLLQFTRQANTRQFLLVLILMTVAGYFTQSTHNIFDNPVLGIINAVAYSVINTLFYVIDRLLYKKEKGFVTTLIFPSVYVVVETLVTFTIGTSGILAHTQFFITPLIQLSTLIGMFGISFIICWFASVFYWLYENNFKTSFIKKATLYYGGVFLTILLYGTLRTSFQPSPEQTLKVATVSGITDLHGLVKQKYEVFKELGENPDSKIPPEIFSDSTAISLQIDNTRKAAKNGAKLIVWNEASLILNAEQIDSILIDIKNIAVQNSSYILAAFFEENTSDAPKPFNNKCILITNKGQIGWEYLKSFPTPAEQSLINPGNSIVPFYDIEYGRIASVICYDIDFPTLMMQANNNKVNILLIPAYDWKGFAAMHSKMAKLEALQSGKAMVRANGNGINTITDSYGNVLAENSTFKHNDTVLMAELPLTSATTLYSKTGNIFTFFCFVLLIAIISFRNFYVRFNKQKTN